MAATSALYSSITLCQAVSARRRCRASLSPASKQGRWCGPAGLRVGHARRRQGCRGGTGGLASQPPAPGPPFPHGLCSSCAPPHPHPTPTPNTTHTHCRALTLGDVLQQLLRLDLSANRDAHGRVEHAPLLSHALLHRVGRRHDPEAGAAAQPRVSGAPGGQGAPLQGWRSQARRQASARGWVWQASRKTGKGRHPESSPLASLCTWQRGKGALGARPWPAARASAPRQSGRTRRAAARLRGAVGQSGQRPVRRICPERA
jgi:hypothetical protein